MRPRAIDLITDRRKLRKMWLKGGGRLDLLASLPLDYLLLATLSGQAQLALLPRMLRLLRLSRVSRHLNGVRVLLSRTPRPGLALRARAPRPPGPSSLQSTSTHCESRDVASVTARTVAMRTTQVAE